MKYQPAMLLKTKKTKTVLLTSRNSIRNLILPPKLWKRMWPQMVKNSNTFILSKIKIMILSFYTQKILCLEAKNMFMFDLFNPFKMIPLTSRMKAGNILNFTSLTSSKSTPKIKMKFPDFHSWVVMTKIKAIRALFKT